MILRYHHHVAVVFRMCVWHAACIRFSARRKMVWCISVHNNTSTCECELNWQNLPHFKKKINVYYRKWYAIVSFAPLQCIHSSQQSTTTTHLMHTHTHTHFTLRLRRLLFISSSSFLIAAKYMYDIYKWYRYIHRTHQDNILIIIMVDVNAH